ncbi:MAG TPA: diversity-generating retroelement protein bAvd family protein [Anaerolineae bacterium]|nr:diversity-generating retroelement protein bAvd family protein [Anaerolineae bacterium]
MRDFRKILVWEKSHKLTLQLYKITSSFPKDELYGLTSQIRRAAGSIPANIAEGCGRNTQTELARFIHIAGGSASELEYHLILAHDLGYIQSSIYPELSESINEIKRMLNGFEKTVQFNAKKSNV